MAAVGVTLVLLACYLATLLPGVGFSGDTAKFQYIGRVLGTPHQTGYPLYVLLNAAFVRAVPFGSLAWRANLLSAVLAAAACGLLVLVLTRLGCRLPVAAGTALTFGLTVTLWAQAVVAEVYTLHVLACVAALGLLLHWQRAQHNAHLVGAAAVLGLSLGNHLMTLLLVPGIVAFVLLVDRTVLRRQVLLPVVGVAALGLTSYAFIVWRSFNPSPLSYLQSRATSLPELLDVLRGAEFSGRLFGVPFDLLLAERVPNVGRYLREEWSWLLLIVPLGMLRRANLPLAVLLVCWSVADIVFVLNYEVVDVQVFMIVTYLCVAVWLALAFDRIWDGIERRTGQVGALRAIIAALAVVALPFAFARWHWERIEASKNLPAAVRARAAVSAVPDGALLLGPDYESSQFLLYWVLGEGAAEHRRLVVAEEPEARAVASYLRGDGSRDTEGGEAGRGRPVYALAERTVEEVTPFGVRSRRVAADLWRLERGPS
ncbi:hypothetical protein BH18ACT1_BH18ACT1_06450 [soil metagenome]